MLNGLAMGLSVVFIVVQIPWRYWIDHIVVIDAITFLGGTWFAASIGGQELAQDTFVAAIVLTLALRTCRLFYRRHTHGTC